MKNKTILAQFYFYLTLLLILLTGGFAEVRFDTRFSTTIELTCDNLNEAKFVTTVLGSRWVGIGVGDNGMQNADMVVCHKDSNSNELVVKRYWTPAIPTNQNQPLQGGTVVPGAECEHSSGDPGYTAMTFTRSLKNNTATENAILTGLGNITNFIWAYGQTTTFTYHVKRGSKPVDMSADAVTRSVTVVSVEEEIVQSTVETTLNFATTKLQLLDLPWIKIVPPGVKCDSAKGTTDAIDGGYGRLKFINETLGSFDLLTNASEAQNYVVCEQCRSRDGWYSNLTAGRDMIEVTPAPTVESLKQDKAERLHRKTLEFLTERQVNNSMSYIKILQPNTMCNSVAGVSDAINGGKGRLIYVNATKATFSFYTNESTKKNYVVCQSRTESGTYADLDTLEIVPALSVQHILENEPLATDKTSAQATVETMLIFAVTGQTYALRPFIKFIEPTVTCNGTDASDASTDLIPGGAGRLIYASPTRGAFLLNANANAGGMTFKICQSRTKKGTVWTDLTEVSLGNKIKIQFHPKVTKLKETKAQLTVETWLTFETENQEGCASSFIKFVPEASTCSADDAIGGAGQLVYSSNNSATLLFNPKHNVLGKYKVCQSRTETGNYTDQDGGASIIEITAAPAVKKLVQTKALRNIPTMLIFDTSKQVSCATSYIKITPPGTACNATNGTTDAITGGFGQLTFASSNYATFSLHTNAEERTGYRVCQSRTTDGTYAALSDADDTIAISSATLRLTVLFLEDKVVERTVPTILVFETTGQVPGFTSYIKIIPNNTKCNATKHISDSIPGGAGRLHYVDDAKANYTLNTTAQVGFYRVCQSDFNKTFRDLTAGEFIVEITNPPVPPVPPVPLKCETKYTTLFNLTHDKKEVTITVTFTEIGWMLIGIGDNGYINADIFVCSSRSDTKNSSLSVKRYWSNATEKLSNGTEVAGASCTQSKGKTTMEFTRKVANASATENPIKIGADEMTTFIYAYEMGSNVFRLQEASAECDTKYNVNKIATVRKKPPIPKVPHKNLDDPLALAISTDAKLPIKILTQKLTIGGGITKSQLLYKKATFKTGLAQSLGVNEADIAILSIGGDTNRRRNRRLSRRTLLSAVDVVYTANVNSASVSLVMGRMVFAADSTKSSGSVFLIVLKQKLAAMYESFSYDDMVVFASYPTKKDMPAEKTTATTVTTKDEPKVDNIGLYVLLSGGSVCVLCTCIFTIYVCVTKNYGTNTTENVKRAPTTGIELKKSSSMLNILENSKNVKVDINARQRRMSGRVNRIKAAKAKREKAKNNSDVNPSRLQ